jgi:DNA-binding CsgD family transcriptional regulator/TolA-binding protein
MSPSNRYLQSGSHRERSWSEEYEALKNKQEALNNEELYQLALAAYLTGKDEEGIDILARTHHQFLENKKIRQAIRCAFWIGMLLMFKGERARGSGWFSRAQRLVEEHQYEGAEKGLLLIPAGLGSLGAGNAETAYANFAHEAGKGYNDPDLTTLSLLGQGQAMIPLGNISEGIALLDEAMVAVESADISPLVVGIVYCAVIETCHKIFDIRRAQEWTAVLSQWCESQPDLIPFRGQCLIRRSQIMHIHGEWSGALREMQRACQILSKPPGEPAAGEAYYLLAEIFRLRGDFQQAEKLYVTANKWGRKPQPGLALLRLAQNEKDLAIKSIRNAMDETKAPLQRIKILQAYIEIMLVHDKIAEARSAVDELDTVAEKYGTTFLEAITTYCRGAVFLKEGDLAAAIDSLSKSLNFLNDLNAPYEAAAARLLLGIAYRAQGDQDTAAMELAAARWIFKELEALPDLEKVEALLNIKNEPDLHGLTLRELQVLRLVSEGETNKAIAGKLFISERTVERHLSNIFNKLQVNSRTEATTFAYKHKIF